MEKYESHNPTNRPIKILLVVRWPVGGIRTFMRYVYRNFDPHCYQFTIIAPDLEEMKTLTLDLNDINVSFLPVIGLPIDGSSGFGLMFWSVLKQIFKEKCDLVHSHGFTSAMCATIPALLHGVPHLMTSHDVINLKQFRGVKGLLKRMGMGVLFRYIDCIHCVSNDAKMNLLTFFPSLRRHWEKVIVIANGVETSRFLVEDKEDFRQIEGVGQADFIIGFFGRYMAQKGFRYLVEAIEILSKRSLSRGLKVLCFGWGGFIREEQEMLSRKRIRSFFIFLPFRANIASALRGMDVVVMPSLWEAYGLLAAESLVAGVPLIGSDCLGLREVLCNTPAQIVPAGDAKALADAIVQEMLNPTTEKADAFRGAAAERFDVYNQAVGLEKIIDNICSPENNYKKG